MALDHERERALVVAAAAGALADSWPLLEGLDGVDWGWMLPRVRELRMAARLWSELVRAAADRGLPQGVRQDLEGDAQETAAGAALRAEATRQAGAALDDAGVRWMPMKGAALGLLLPSYAATRAALDVDLVVPADELERARRALAAALPLLGERRDYDGAERDADAAMRDGVQHLYAFEGAGGVPIELHHSFPALTNRRSTEDIFARARAVQVRGRTVRLAAPEDLLGTACVHAYYVHWGDRAVAFRHLADVSELLAHGASPDLARARYDVEGRSSVAQSLHELAAAREEARSRGAPVSTAAHAVEPGAGGRVVRWAVTVGGRGRQLSRALRRYGLDVVVPPRSFMVALYGPAASGPRLPLLHAHRWGAILWRMVRGR